MSKLKNQVWYYARCEYCQKISSYLVRDVNVNVMTDEDIRKIAQHKLGRSMNVNCNHCRLFTLKTVVAYKW